MWVGPYGSSIMAAMEAKLAGRNINFSELTPRKFAKLYHSSWQDAVESIKNATERTEGVIGKTGPLAFRKAVSLPANLLTQGDIAARKMLQSAGFTADEARTITLTSEPFTGWGTGLGKWRNSRSEITGQQSLFAHMVLPFWRTNVNQLEQSLVRFPMLCH